MSLLFAALHQAAQAHRAALAAQQPHLSPSRIALTPAVERPWWRRGGVLLLGVLGGAGVMFLLLRQPTPQPRDLASAVLDTTNGINLSSVPTPIATPLAMPKQVREQLPEPVLAAIADQISPYVEPRKKKRAPMAEPSKDFWIESNAPRDRGGASAALSRGEYQNALVAYEAVLAYDPKNKDALSGKALALQQSGRASAALPIWRKLHEQYPQDAAITTRYASALSNSDAPAARAILKKLLATQPQYAPALAAMASLSLKVGDMDAAQHAQEQAWSLDRDNPAYRLNLAILADRRGDRAQALALYKQAQAAYLAGGGKANLPMSWDAVQARVDYLTEKTR